PRSALDKPRRRRGVQGRRVSRAARVRAPRPPAAGRTRAPPGIRPARVPRPGGIRRRARRRRPRRGARRGIRARDRGARPAGDPRALSGRRRRPPERERALDLRRRRSDHDPRRRAERPALGGRGGGAPRRPPAPRGDGVGVRQAGPARRRLGGGRRGAGGGARVSGVRGAWAGRRMHFVGVGGAGMSGYARVARTLGAEISGSDRASTPYLRALASDGVLRASIGHAAEHVPTGEGVELVYSSAVAEENVERRAARERGIPERPRAALLSELTALKRTIAVAGTHGKTTTASMLVHALLAAGLDPGWLVGGSIGDGKPNAEWGKGDWLVVEADESDRSMLSLNVEIAVLTNIELDHHSAFGSLSALREAFREFLAGAPSAAIWDRPAP